MMKNELKVFRAKKEITQKELATEMDVSRQTINAIETDKYNPSLELALKLSGFFNCSVEELFKLEDD